MKKLTIVAAAVSALCAGPALAQPRSDWSVLGAETVPSGADVLSGHFGWPDISFGYTHGVSPGFDAGVRMSFLFGVENTTASKFGIAAAVPLRWTLSRSSSARLLLHVDPGLRLYTFSDAWFGFQAPIGLNVEFATHSPVKLGMGADFNLTLFLTGAGSPRFFFGPLIGPYLEYHIDPRLALGFDTRFGAIIDAFSAPPGFRGGGTDTRFGFRAQMMLAYRL